MNRILFLVASIAVTWGGLLLLLAISISPAEFTVATLIWLGSASVALSNCALELALLPVWLWLRLTSQLHHDPYVPLELTPSEARRLADRSPRTAILIPAHKEATTTEDREAFVERLVELLRQTPAWSFCYLLFDSPIDQRANELWVVADARRRLSELRRTQDGDRLQYVEYRNKAAHLKNKPGSIVLWLNEFAERFEFFFVLDADSSVPASGPRSKEERDVLERLVAAMLREPRLAMIQTRIQIRRFETIWGWFQAVNTSMAARYHGPLYQWILEGSVPSYGHTVLFRTVDFVAHVKNTLHYLSHDYLDAADLAAAGKLCVFTHRAVTYELGEDSLLGYAIRDLRWARGNSQWLVYWLTKPRLPLGPRLFITIGIMSYVWPLLTTTLAVTGCVLAGDGVELIAPDRPLAVLALASLVAVSLLLPRALAARSPAEFNLSSLVGFVISPALLLLKGMVFLVGAFGNKWSPRGVRSLALNLDHLGKMGGWFYPVSMFGLVLHLEFLQRAPDAGLGPFLLRAHVLLLIVSPLIAIVFSKPLPFQQVVEGSEPCDHSI